MTLEGKGKVAASLFSAGATVTVGSLICWGIDVLLPRLVLCVEFQQSQGSLLKAHDTQCPPDLRGYECRGSNP